MITLNKLELRAGGGKDEAVETDKGVEFETANGGDEHAAAGTLRWAGK